MLQGGPGRNKDALIELSIYKMAAQHETYPLTGVNTQYNVLSPE